MRPPRGRSRRSAQAEERRSAGWQHRHAPNDPASLSAETEAFGGERSRNSPPGDVPTTPEFPAEPDVPDQVSWDSSAAPGRESRLRRRDRAPSREWMEENALAEGAVVGDVGGDEPPPIEYQEPLPSRFVTSPTGYTPPVWSWAGYAWRFGRYLTIPRINRLLRLGFHQLLPQTPATRFVMMGLPPEVVDQTIRRVRHLDDWAEAWTGTAQRFLSETRRGGNLLSPQEAALARQRAAMCYHVAPFFALGDERLARASRSSATTLFNQSVGLLMPDTHRVVIRWRTKSLPGYVTLPSQASEPVPLVVLLNGLTTAKEELVMWQDAFLSHGLAVLALDWPGTGEVTALGPIRPDCDDIAEGLFEFIEEEPAINGEQVVLVGLSLGGAVAISNAAQDRRVAAAVAVTPPYEPWMWLGAANELVLAQIAAATGGYDRLARYAVELNLPAAVERLRVPLLVLGAGRDLVVPPAEAERLAATAGDLATLIWYEHADHALFNALPTWTEDVAGWIAMIFGLPNAFSPEAATPDVTSTEWEEGASEGPVAPEAAAPGVSRERAEIPSPPSGTDFGPLGPAAARILAGEAPAQEDERGSLAASPELEDDTDVSESAEQMAPESRPLADDSAATRGDAAARDEWRARSAENSRVVPPDSGDESSRGIRATGTFAGGRGVSPQVPMAEDDSEYEEWSDDPHAPYRPPPRTEP